MCVGALFTISVGDSNIPSVIEIFNRVLVDVALIKPRFSDRIVSTRVPSSVFNKITDQPG